MRAVAGDGFADMLQRFAVSAQEQLLAIRAALLRGDAETLREVAHKLKGTAATLGARGLMRSCACLEEQARTGQLALAAEHIESLASQCIDAGATLQAALNEKGPIM
jgi:HPt (histidine-containing phosphotransfer) domain-containing protein